MILPNDPAFDIDFQLPLLDLDGDAIMAGLNSIHGVGNTFSQLSPLDAGSISASGHGSFPLGPQLPSSVASHAAGQFFGTDGPSSIKNSGIIMPFGDEDEAPLGGDLLRIDADGNIIEESQLPAHSIQQQQEAVGEAAAVHASAPQPAGAVPVPGDVDLQMVFGEEPLPEAEALPARQRPLGDGEAGPSRASVAAAASLPRERKPRVYFEAEGVTRIPRDVFQSWSDNYVENQKQILEKREHKRRLAVTLRRAEQNAFITVFGRGINDVGLLDAGFRRNPDKVHPLAEMFAGVALRDSLMGDPAEQGDAPRGRRQRSSSEVLGGDDGNEGGRRVRPRIDDGEQVGRGQPAEDERSPMFVDAAVEMGRDPGSILSDQPALPWNRQSSAVPSSAKGSAQKPAAAARQDQSSPLAGRRSILPDIERFSDNAAPVFGSDGAADPDLAMFDDSEPSFNIARGTSSQAPGVGLDLDDRRFMDFVVSVARDKGVYKAENNGDGRYWIQFDDLLGPEDSKPAVATQAFYHVLTLVSKTLLAVEQDDTPFGKISIGVKLDTEKSRFPSPVSSDSEDIDVKPSAPEKERSFSPVYTDAGDSPAKPAPEKEPLDHSRIERFLDHPIEEVEVYTSSPANPAPEKKPLDHSRIQSLLDHPTEEITYTSAEE